MEFLESVNIPLGSYEVLVAKKMGSRITGRRLNDMPGALSISAFCRWESSSGP